jgi:hypothetical protein
MIPPRYNDCVLTKRPSFWNFVEKYHHLEGLFRFKKYEIEKSDQQRGIHYLKEIVKSPVGTLQVAATILKILSIATLIFPLIMIAAKYYYRSTSHFVIEAPGNSLPPGINPLQKQAPRQPQMPPVGGAATYPQLGPREPMDTNIVRNFASVRIEPSWVLRDAMRFFRASHNQRVSKLPRAALQEFKRRHGVEGRIHVHSALTLEQLAQNIAALKRDGVEGYKSYNAMIDMINTLLKKPAYQDMQSKAFKLLTTFRTRLIELKEDRKVLDRMMILVERGNIGEAEKLAENLAESKVEDAKKPEFQEIGVKLEGGWRRMTGGHRIDVEMKQVNGKWQFIAAQAGSGSQNHRHKFRFDQNNQPVSMQVIPVKIFEVDSEAEAKDLAKKIYLYKRGPDSLKPANGKEGDGFYALFANARVIDEHNLAYRRDQSMGNCALRSQEESFFYICQRQGLVDVANDFLNTLQDKIAHNAYPALQKKIAARGPKESIQPLVEASANLQICEPGGKGVHFLPLVEKARYIIGRSGEIALPKTDKYSREQAEILFEKGKVYIARNSFVRALVTVIKPDGSKRNLGANERVEVQPGDLLRFSDEYDLRVT